MVRVRLILLFAKIYLVLHFAENSPIFALKIAKMTTAVIAYHMKNVILYHKGFKVIFLKRFMQIFAVDRRFVYGIMSCGALR